MFVLLVLEHPLGPYDVDVMILWLLNESPYFIAGEALEFFFHSNDPIRIRQCFMHLKWFKVRNKSMTATKGYKSLLLVASLGSPLNASKDIVDLNPTFYGGGLNIPDGPFTIDEFIL